MTRYQVNYIASYDGDRPLLSYSCERMKRELGLCVAECGVKNPLSHNRPRGRSEPAEAGRVLLPLSVLREFLGETGLAEFSYEPWCGPSGS